MGGGAILRAAYREKRIKQDDEDLAVILSAVMQILGDNRR
jgi:hypothetical protein